VLISRAKTCQCSYYRRGGGSQHRDNPLNPRLRPDYLDPFINVARLICQADPPTWLAEPLWRWNRWLYRDRRVEEMRPTRGQMRSILREVENAALLLMEALAPSWTREFLDVSFHGPIVDGERLIRTLEDLSDRASQARDGPDLAAASGVTKPGPGKARPEGMSPRTLCAVMIWEAWKHVHKAEPAPKNRQAALAAEAYWRAAGGEGRHSGKYPLASWRHHFEKAAASGGEDFRAEWRRGLVESERRWIRRNSASDAA
jgi:hypothetical protein